MEEIDINIELMILQYYIEAMKKHETSKPKLEDLDNLMIHVSNLKEWVRIKESTEHSNCNLPRVINWLPLRGKMLDVLNKTYKRLLSKEPTRL